ALVGFSVFPGRRKVARLTSETKRKTDGALRRVQFAKPLAGLFSWNLLALFARLRKSNCNGLFATFNCSAFATPAAFQLATFKFVHFALYVFRGARRISSCHENAPDNRRPG